MSYSVEKQYKRGQFFTMPNALFEKHKLSPYAIAIYAFLMYKKDKRNQCYPSRKRIADFCGIGSVSTVDKYLQELEFAGLINKTTRKKYGEVENDSNMYDMLYIEAENKRRRK